MSVAARDDGGSEVVRLPQRTPFTMVDNPIIRGMSDYVALGLYLDMLSHPSGWRINIRQLAKTHKQGRQVLTDAMNDLIARGLVFRLRSQEASGRWSTRTYVCSSPVTLEELDEVRRQYHRCVIETTPTLTEALTVPAPAPVEARHEDNSRPESMSARPAPAPLVTPSARFPAPGDPESGPPDTGPPNSDDLASQESEGRRKNPPPTPDTPHRPRKQGPLEGEEGPTLKTADPPTTTVRHPDLSHVLDAVASAWPTLGRRDLQQLQPLLRDALEALPAGQIIDHLVTNTGGARHPAALVRARLHNLPPPRRRRRQADWCGACTSENYRWIQDQNGQPIRPCPTCSPQAIRGSGTIPVQTDRTHHDG